MSRLVILFVIGCTLIPGLGRSSSLPPDPSPPPDQANCTLTVEKSPVIRGIRLGMDDEQLYALFPEGMLNKNMVRSAEGYPNFGVARLFFQVSNSPSVTPATKERFAGIDSMQITLFDGRVTELQIAYACQTSYPVRGPVWRNVDDLIAKLSETFGLPNATDWFERSQWTKALQCTGFTLSASIDGGKASVSLRTTTDYEKTVRQRSSAEEEKRRREFKP